MRPTTFMIPVLALLGSFSGQAEAQQVPGGAEPEKGNGSVTINFPGGTLESYLKALSEVSGESNVVLSPGAANITLPPFSLKGVPLQSAIEVIQFMAREGQRNVSVSRIPAGAGGRMLCVISAGEKNPEKRSL